MQLNHCRGRADMSERQCKLKPVLLCRRQCQDGSAYICTFIVYDGGLRGDGGVDWWKGIPKANESMVDALIRFPKASIPS